VAGHVALGRCLFVSVIGLYEGEEGVMVAMAVGGRKKLAHTVYQA